ncbi:MAG: hypothetical protein RBS28_09245 [Rhodocyclaceae bacterium]|jgi:hypothetical protein|nr:hypothetical protein [Rhodocyclaceae bacterium]
MKGNAPAARTPLNKLPPALKRWLWRIAIAAAILSLIGLSTHPTVSPLLCKIYG